MSLKFYYNGIKANGGKLQRAFLWDSSVRGRPEGTITVSARDYTGFSREVHEAFAVSNDTDLMTDYFDKDSFYVEPNHPLYGQVKTALEARQARYAR